MCPHARDRSGREQGRPASRTLGLRPPRRARARWLARDAHCTKGFAIGSRPSAGATSVTHVPRHTVRPSGRRSSVTTPASAGSRSDSTVSSSTRLRISSYPWRARAAAWRLGARVGASQPRSCMVHARGADDVQIGRSAAAQRCTRRNHCPPKPAPPSLRARPALGRAHGVVLPARRPPRPRARAPARRRPHLQHPRDLAPALQLDHDGLVHEFRQVQRGLLAARHRSWQRRARGRRAHAHGVARPRPAPRTPRQKKGRKTTARPRTRRARVLAGG